MHILRLPILVVSFFSFLVQMTTGCHFGDEDEDAPTIDSGQDGDSDLDTGTGGDADTDTDSDTATDSDTEPGSCLLGGVAGLVYSSPSDLRIIGYREGVGVAWHVVDGQWQFEQLPEVFSKVYVIAGESLVAINSAMDTIWAYRDGQWRSLYTAQAELYGIWAASDTEIFAVGRATGAGSVVIQSQGTDPDSLTWEETQFEGYGLSGVWGISAQSVYIVGDNAPEAAFYHWDGTDWSAVPHTLTIAGLTAIWGTADTDIWVASDEAASNGAKGPFGHYDGTTWREYPTTGNNKEWIEFIWGPDANTLFAGGLDTLLEPPPTDLYHFNGAQWVAVDIGYDNIYRFTTMAGVQDDIYVGTAWHGEMTGENGEGPIPRVLHYDGTSWSVLCWQS